MLLNFSKMHGCGNDYVYVNCLEKNLLNPGAVAKYVSPRCTSVGSDGLILIGTSTKADFSMRIFNADASEGKMCGNGIRCVAKYVYDRGLTDKKQITIETLSGIKTVTVTVVDGKVTEASVAMGCPVFRCTEIPMISDHYIFVDQGLVLKETYEEKIVYNGTAISMGNPHYVTFVDDVDALNLPVLGPQFEHHKLFPEGVNTCYRKSRFRLAIYSKYRICCTMTGYSTIVNLRNLRIIDIFTKINDFQLSTFWCIKQQRCIRGRYYYVIIPSKQ